MERIEAFNNNCTLVAVKAVMAGTADDTAILAAFREEGYVNNQGMTHYRWTNAAKRLGLELETVKIPRRDGKYVCRENRWGELKEVYVSGRYTITEFCKDNPVGVFFVSLATHAIVIVDGKIHDPNCIWNGTGRGVKQVKRVLNSPLQAVPEGKISTLKLGKPMTKGFERRSDALMYIREHGPQFIEILIRETSYTKADGAWDVKRGNLRYVEGS